jgi:plasmid stabilization system protein ParE
VNVSLAESAFYDLEAIKAYYSEQGAAAIGENFVKDILTHIEVLSDNPEIGRIVPEFDEPKIRELIHPPFRVVHVLESESIVVIRVWRSERLLVLPRFN